MTEKWFIEDIEFLIGKRNRVVISDPGIQCGFLLKMLENKGYVLLKTDSSLTEPWQTVKEELFLRYEAETTYKQDKVIFYVTRETDKLSFLYDYCTTHGCLDLSDPAEWLKKKLFSNTGLQIKMDNKTLLIAGKLGIGKNIAWWKRILQELEDLVSLEHELIPFLDDPERFSNDMDVDVYRMFEDKLFDILEQPYIKKNPGILAEEVVNKLFEGLENNNISDELLRIYYKWVDSDTYRPSLMKYISKHKASKSVDPWAVHPDHCFNAIDLKELGQLIDNLVDKSYVMDKLGYIKTRVDSKKVPRFVPVWWDDIIVLFEFDTALLTSCKSLNEVVEFYTSQFSKVDRAIRKLYSIFLSEERIILPLQGYYENLNYELLQKWFEYSNEYKSDQKGYLVNLIKKSDKKSAVIVADGLRYEIADYIASSLEDQLKVKKHSMLADVPSETENNMSSLYTKDGVVLSDHKDRKKKLSEAAGRYIKYSYLEDLSYGENADIIVFTYKDIDYTGEKLQQGAIKLFDEFETVLSEKITQLLDIGYEQVHLITDHGFVLTGVLAESDKIPPDVHGKNKVHERFIRTVSRQNNSYWIEFEKEYGEYKYLYVSKSHRPFRSKGDYGYSHGGFTPQEIIIPDFIFKKRRSLLSGLKVIFSNKPELTEITGNNFVVKLKASEGHDLFSYRRKVQVLLYKDNISYRSSNIINIEAGKTTEIEFSSDINTELKAVLIDAETHEQLDIAIVKKSNARNLDGLV
jgi:hypothetical protein